MQFTKWHGLGNHFIVTHSKRSEIATFFDSKFIRQICDPHFGVGSDGIMVIESDPIASAIEVWMFNPDGTLMGMCGNGIRCAYGYARKHLNINQSKINFIVEGRPIIVEGELVNGNILATVNMGYLKVFPKEVVMQGDHEYEGYFVEAPNPHFVIPSQELPTTSELVEIGTLLENNPRFKERANIEFAKQISEEEIQVIVWERGAGITQACGTGACAVAAAYFYFQGQGQKRTIQLPGGALTIEVLPDSVLMTGPAVEIYKGTYNDIES